MANCGALIATTWLGLRQGLIPCRRLETPTFELREVRMTINEIIHRLQHAKTVGDKTEVKRLEQRLLDRGANAAPPAQRAAKRVTKAAEKR